MENCMTCKKMGLGNNCPEEEKVGKMIINLGPMWQPMFIRMKKENTMCLGKAWESKD